LTAANLNRGRESAQVPGAPACANVGRVDHACQTAAEGRLAARAVAQWARQFQLGESEFQILWRLRWGPEIGLDQTALATSLALSPAQVSSTVELLHARKLISQQMAVADRRRRLWCLSADGHRLVSEMLSAASGLRYTSAMRTDVSARASERRAAA